ncbi:peptidase [Dickeya phage vB_DsoM_JA29]|uniref:Uncharacterized protein n=1 Tax=Dickeya phage vB_DsoM_JA29 TaxID=2283031 RepID=A0A384ZXC6_9CAUD|nr:peptidase [Dickeya phage vB_DsoM_JA29]AXG66923.1 hypothetical protein JA29_197 [Dickeya phage vB_DsoM_JA29]
MKHRAGEYLVVRSGNKNVLVLATGKTVGYLVNTLSSEEPTTIKFSAKYDILAILGKDPEPGQKVFGVGITPYVGLKQISGMPALNLYGREEQVGKAIRIACKKFPSYVEKYGVGEALRRCKEINFNQVSGGSKTHDFKTKFAKEEWHDSFNICVNKDSLSQDVTNNMLLALGESIYQHLVPTKRKIKWILLLNKLRNVQKLDQETLIGFLDDFLKAGDAKDVKNLVSEDLLPFTDIILRSIARQRVMSVKELELLAQNDSEAIAKFWPAELEVSDARPDIDKSAMKSARALFAYSFSRFAQGIDLGKTLNKAVRLTVKEFRGDVD